MNTRTLTAGVIGGHLAVAALVTAVVVTAPDAHAGGAHAATSTVSATVPPPARAAWMIRPCAEEDSLNCAWNAAARGNGLGHSFYRVRRQLVDAHGNVTGHAVCLFYVKRADARRWDACHILPAGQDGTL